MSITYLAAGAIEGVIALDGMNAFHCAIMFDLEYAS